MSEEKTEAKKKTKRRISPATWLEITKMAREGIPVTRIAKIFSLDESNIRRHLKSRGISHGEALVEREEAKARKEREDLLDKIKKIKEQELQVNEYITKRTVKLLMDADKNGERLESKYKDIKTLKVAADILGTTLSSKWKVLGLDKEAAEVDKYVPELSIREMTMEEIRKHKNGKVLSTDDFSDEEMEKLDEALKDIVEEGDEDEDFEDDWGGGNDKDML